MVPILSGPLLWRLYPIREERRDRGFPKCKRVLGRMWSVLSMCFSLDRVSFETLHWHELKSFGRWWLLVWSCTTWSWRMSVMIASTTKGLISRVKMLSLSIHLLQPSNGLVIFIINCVIGVLMSSSRMTWLSTYGFTLATSRAIGLIPLSCKQILIGL